MEAVEAVGMVGVEKAGRGRGWSRAVGTGQWAQALSTSLPILLPS